MKTSIFKRIRWLLVTAVICGGMFLTKPTTAFGDVLILTDGTVVQGLILSKSPDQVYVKDRQGEYRHYAMSDISRVEWRGTVETEGQVVSVRHTPEGADMAVPMSIRRQVDPQIAAAAARIIADSGPRFAGPDGGSIADPNWLVGPFHEAEPIQKKVVSTKPISSLGARTYTSARRSSDTSGKASATPRSSKSSRSSSSEARSSRSESRSSKASRSTRSRGGELSPEEQPMSSRSSRLSGRSRGGESAQDEYGGVSLPKRIGGGRVGGRGPG